MKLSLQRRRFFFFWQEIARASTYSELLDASIMFDLKFPRTKYRVVSLEAAIKGKS